MTHHEGHHAEHGKSPHGHPEKKEPAPPAPAGAPSAAPPAANLQQQLEAKTREAADLLDQLQRLAAEYSNYQKRVERRQEEENTLALRGMVLDLLPALDNFDRALAAACQKPTFEALLEGVTLVHNQILSALARHGVTIIEAGGKTFDPEHHEAVACVPSQTHASGEVIEQFQRGYQLNGRTIRPAHVAVSGGLPPPAEEKQDKPSDPQA
jgi:molecular chaperone GrpE